jgi:hypothetical protein
MGVPRPPETDPTLGIPVAVDRSTRPAHRLVTIGDSITQGFMSGAIFRTDLSWPAIVALELGLRPGEDSRYPAHEAPNGPGGLPLDLERLANGLATRVGDKLDWYEAFRAARWVRSYMDKVEDYWERGDGRTLAPTDGPFHNLAVYGADVLDVQLMQADVVDGRLAATPARDDLVRQVVERDNDRAWRTVLEACRGAGGPDRAGTVLDAARALGAEGDGIETLIVVLGANNALGSVFHLKTSWTPDDYLDTPPAQRLDAKGAYNVWQPAHFAAEWATLVEVVRTINARHVLVATVPQVTIAPIARGVSAKLARGSRYFPYYTRPWIDDDDFDPGRDPHLTGDEARAIDEAIDGYNAAIIASVRAAREDGLDWYLLELGGLLDSLAARRYLEDPAARPAWWEPYVQPPELAVLAPAPNTRFFRSGLDGRTEGGLFSLDGVHPTTIGYGILAGEVVRVLRDHVGMDFFTPLGAPRERASVRVDFARVLASDTLVSRPPRTIASTVALLGWLDQTLDWVGRIVPFR